jgi:hypothetical protein
MRSPAITVLSLLLSAAALVTFASTASAAPPVAAVTGNDVSWPQCGKTLPSGQAFAIVGVNDGLANNTNPCLSTQLSWANTSKGGTGQPKVALYVNTANPSGVAGIWWWPTSNTFTDPIGGETVTVPTPARYGDCSTTNDTGCAYVYGYAKAYDDVQRRGVPAVDPAGKAWTWWLDVETTNSWETTNLTANLADLEGMAYYFHDINGANVGIYSTGYQWNVITGTPTSTTLNASPNWIPGAKSLKAAQSNCTTKAFTPNSPVVLTQYTSGQFDYDYSCP